MSRGKDSHFTLIELLTVIAIIMILAALLLPAVSKVRFRAKVNQARTDIKALQMAVKQYETTYGYLPYTSIADFKTNDTAFGQIIARLAGTNARGIIFLELQAGNVFKDPWAKNYVMALDTTYDGKITQSVIGNPPASSDIPGSVAVWSDGDGEQWITSWNDD
jgi:type II secretory pathway pseudopilin PulG